MKLTLSLRSALLAVCALAGAPAAKAGDAYWTDTSNTRHALSPEEDDLTVRDAAAFVLEDMRYEMTDDYLPGDEVCLRLNITGAAVISAQSVTISGNGGYDYAAAGAIRVQAVGEAAAAQTLSFEGCGTVSITGNFLDSAYSLYNYTAGAIHVYGNAIYDDMGRQVARTTLEFKGNDHVLIEGNYVTDGNTRVMRAIETSYTDLVFAAKEGQDIRCYDALTVDGYLWVNTSPISAGDGGETYAGTVILSGEKVEQNLAKLEEADYIYGDVYNSKLIKADGIYVAGGTLILRDINISLDDHGFVDRESFDGFYCSEQAQVQLTNVELHVWSSLPQHRNVTMPNATFSGYNFISADTINADHGLWVFNVSERNLGGGALVDISTSSDPSDPEAAGYHLSTDGATFRIIADGGLASGEYWLISLSNPYQYQVQWNQWESVVLEGTESSAIGEGDVYFTIQDDYSYVLVYNHTSEKDIPEPEDRPLGKLTWDAEVQTGLWATGAEDEDYHWRSENDKPTHYRDGDAVVISSEVALSIPGTVKPASILVNNAKGTVQLGSPYEEGGLITGSARLTKEGAGELLLYTDNATTGGLLIKEGRVDARSSRALGLGEIELQGGTLYLNFDDEGSITNAVRVTGTATIYGFNYTNSEGEPLYEGKLTLDGGKLQALEGLYIKESAELLKGDISLKSEGEGTLVKKSKGTVTITRRRYGEGDGAQYQNSLIDNKGGVVVEEGGLIIEGTTLRCPITVNDGATLMWRDAELQGEMTLHAGAEALAEALTLGRLPQEDDEDDYYDSPEAKLTLEGAKLNGNVLVAPGGTLAVKAAQTINGAVTLQGGVLQLNAALAVVGDLTLSGGTVQLGGAVQVVGFLQSTEVTDIELDTQELREKGSMTLFTAGNVSMVEAEHFHLTGLEGSRAAVHVDAEAKSVLATMNSQELTWLPTTGAWTAAEDGGEWSTREEGVDKRFYAQDLVIFKNAGEVPIEGEVNPHAIRVTGEGDTAFVEGAGGGSITGQGTLTKEGAGTLKICTDNSQFTGDIIVKGGTLEVGHESALGSREAAAVLIQGATFDGGDFWVDREICVSGSSTLRRVDSVASMRFESKAKVGGSMSLYHTLTIGKAGAEFTGSFSFMGGSRLALTGGAFTLSGQVEFDTSYLEGYMDYMDYIPGGLYEDYGYYLPSVVSIDVSAWEGITREGDYTLLKLKLDEHANLDRLFSVTFGGEEEVYYDLEYVDGDLVLHVISAAQKEENEQVPDKLAEAAETDNQKSVVQALQSVIGRHNMDTTALGIMKELQGSIHDAAAVRAMLDALSGAELATAMTAQMEGNMAHLRRLRANMGSGQRLDNEGKHSAYVLGYDGQNHVDADGGAPGMKRTEWGGVVGLEFGVREQSLFGMALTSGSATVNPTGGESYDEDALRIDLYGVGNFGHGWQSIMSVGVGKHTYSISRRLPGGLTATSSPEGYSLNFQEEVSYTKQINERNSIQPFASIEVSANVIPAFSESGAGNLSLESRDYATSAVDLTLGARYIRSFTAGGGRTGHVSVQAAIILSQGESATEMELHFTGAPERRFKVEAAATDSMGFNLGASVLYPLTKHAAITGSANAILRGGSQETGASVGVKLTF